mmetsp:Transcript_7056/g.11199  ORF Transcript_7056/g.11199 Transcript_7056/m.11199 type:complete len:172 (-) Transcript_7056:883-1398(-)
MAQDRGGGRGVPVRITTGISQQHSRAGFMRSLSQFGEIVYCRKPPYSGIEGEDYVNVGFASQSAADLCYAEIKAGRVFVDGVQVGVGPTEKPARSSRSPRRGGGNDRPARATFKQRHDERTPSPRTLHREAMAARGGGGGGSSRGGGGERSSRRSRSRRRDSSRSRSRRRR